MSGDMGYEHPPEYSASERLELVERALIGDLQILIDNAQEQLPSDRIVAILEVAIYDQRNLVGNVGQKPSAPAKPTQVYRQYPIHGDDEELIALGIVIQLLKGTDDAARGRILRYLSDRLLPTPFPK